MKSPPAQPETTPADQLATALEALTERAFNRCLFPAEVRQAFAALDAYEAVRHPTRDTTEPANGI